MSLRNWQASVAHHDSIGILIMFAGQILDLQDPYCGYGKVMQLRTQLLARTIGLHWSLRTLLSFHHHPLLMSPLPKVRFLEIVWVGMHQKAIVLRMAAQGRLTRRESRTTYASQKAWFEWFVRSPSMQVLAGLQKRVMWELLNGMSVDKVWCLHAVPSHSASELHTSANTKDDVDVTLLHFRKFEPSHRPTETRWSCMMMMMWTSKTTQSTI